MNEIKLKKMKEEPPRDLFRAIENGIKEDMGLKYSPGESKIVSKYLNCLEDFITDRKKTLEGLGIDFLYTLIMCLIFKLLITISISGQERLFKDYIQVLREMKEEKTWSDLFQNYDRDGWLNRLKEQVEWWEHGKVLKPFLKNF